MAALAELTDEEFKEHALDILKRELGAAGFARFLRLYRPGSGNYTEERDQWLAGQTLEQVRARVEGRKESHPASPARR